MEAPQKPRSPHPSVHPSVPPACPQGPGEPGPPVPWVPRAGGRGGLTRKSMPTVAMNVPERKAPSLNCSRKQVFPTPESPSNITCKAGAGEVSAGHPQRHRAAPRPLSLRVPLVPRACPVGCAEPRERRGGSSGAALQSSRGRERKGGAGNSAPEASPGHPRGIAGPRRAGGEPATGAAPVPPPRGVPLTGGWCTARAKPAAGFQGPARCRHQSKQGACPLLQSKQAPAQAPPAQALPRCPPARHTPAAAPLPSHAALFLPGDGIPSLKKATSQEGPALPAQPAGTGPGAGTHRASPPCHPLSPPATPCHPLSLPVPARSRCSRRKPAPRAASTGPQPPSPGPPAPPRTLPATS